MAQTTRPAGNEPPAVPAASDGSRRAMRDLLHAEEERLLACVHCGFCQDVCPTYTRLGDELDSPRGRLYLMRAVAEGRIDPEEDAFGTHIDRCLGCRACEPVCPSGVQYGFLLERARAVSVAARGMPFAERVLLLVFGSRTLTGIVCGAGRVVRAAGLAGLLARRLPARLARLRLALAMLAATRPMRESVRRAVALRARSNAVMAGTGPHGAPGEAVSRNRRRGTRVAVLEGCVQRGLFGHVNAATRRVLEHHGWTIGAAPGQRCCGALHAHAGDLARARELALANIGAFERSGALWIAVNAAGCGAAMKSYAELFEHTPHEERARAFAARVRDVSELLDAGPGTPADAAPAGADGTTSGSGTASTGSRGPAPGARPEAARASPSRATAAPYQIIGPGSSTQLRVTYDAPCHLIHAQGIARAPLDTLLRAAPWLEAVPLEQADECCGGAGLYGLTQARLGRTIGEDKIRAVQAARADIVLTANAGCLMQIGAGLILAGDDTPVMHTIALLDACQSAVTPGKASQ